MRLLETRQKSIPQEEHTTKYANYDTMKAALGRLKEDIQETEAVLQDRVLLYKLRQQTLLDDLDGVSKVLHDLVDNRIKELKVSGC